MPRPLRVQFPGAIYHLMSRGDHREAIFGNDTDRQAFLETLGEACVKKGWQVHAFCLMGNHFHLVAETPQANLGAGLKWLLGTYTGRFNRRHKLFGRLFSGRYKSLIIDERGGEDLRSACDWLIETFEVKPLGRKANRRTTHFESRLFECPTHDRDMARISADQLLETTNAEEEILYWRPAISAAVEK